MSEREPLFKVTGITVERRLMDWLSQRPYCHLSSNNTLQCCSPYGVDATSLTSEGPHTKHLLCWEYFNSFCAGDVFDKDRKRLVVGA